jgi:integral membrane protein
VEAAINRYRILATVVGVMLILVCFVGLPIRLITGNETPSAIISPIHGLLYMVYLVVSFDLYTKAQWPMKKFLVMVSAGLVPFLAFFIERRIVAEAREVVALRQAQA